MDVKEVTFNDMPQISRFICDMNFKYFNYGCKRSNI